MYKNWNLVGTIDWKWFDFVY